MALALTLFPAASRADLLLISDGPSTFSYNPDSPATVLLSGPNHGDLIAEETWLLRYLDPNGPFGPFINTSALRNGADITQTANSNGAIGSTHVDVMSSDIFGVDTDLFDVDTVFRISTDAKGNPVLKYSVTVTNVSGSTQNGALFNYFDFDLVGFGGDSGEKITRPLFEAIQQRDGATDAKVVRGAESIDRWQIQAWNAASNLDDIILGGADLNNSGSPFGPGDMTAATQWDFSLAAGESFTINGFSVVPEPTSFWLISWIGVAAGGRWMWRRRALRDREKSTAKA